LIFTTGEGLVLKFVLIAMLALATSAAAQSSLERGDYLVNAVMACDGCHTPRSPTGFVMEKRFSGGSQTWDDPAYTVKGSNITPDPDTGIGRWSETDIKISLTEGLRPYGMPLAPQMPFPFYKIMTARDLDAVVAYLRSVPAVKNAVQPPVYRATAKVEIVPGADKPLDESALRNPVQRGFYLASLAHCMECHSRRPDGQQDFSSWLGKGGYEMIGPWGKAVVPNITSHETKGIGSWSDAEIKRALTHGVARDGRPFKQPMARQIYFSKMDQTDIDSMVAWLRTLPPLE
jgi:mono/diheme cytochrome c family protein